MNLAEPELDALGGFGQDQHPVVDRLTDDGVLMKKNTIVMMAAKDSNGTTDYLKKPLAKWLPSLRSSDGQIIKDLS